MKIIFAQKCRAGLLAAGLLFLAGGRLAAATPTLLWGDEFNQADNSAPDTTKWNYDLGGGGWGNNELETYTNSRTNSYIISDTNATDGKALVIAAVKDAQGNYTSARLLTLNKFSTTYGRIEARLKTTSGKGLWPAFWMLGTSISTGTAWPDCGEIDIMETIGATPKTAYGTLHGPGYSGANGLQGSSTLAGGASYDQAYHVFSVQWAPDKIEWSVDGTVYHTRTPSTIPAGTNWVFNNSPFFIIMNLAVGGSWPGNPDGTTSFPATYRIDYVRVYGLAPGAPTGALASAGSATQVNLSWAAPTALSGFALTGYRVECSTNSAFTQNLVQHDLGSVLAYADTSVTGGVTYYYRVSAISTGGISDPTTGVSVSTPVSAVAPQIAVQPVGQVVVAGQGVTFTASASGTPTPTYQWRKNAVNLGGATGASYTIASTVPGDAGSYTVVATNTAGTATSNAAVLTINVTPSFSVQPVSQTTMTGGSVTLTAAAGGTPAPTFQWQKNGVDLGGATNATLTLNNLHRADTGSYTVKVTNAAGTVVSTVATIVVSVPTASADFNADAHSDALWHNTTTGLVASWVSGGGFTTFGVEGDGWSVLGQGDFDHDGKGDVLWHNTATGLVASWTSSGGFMTFGAEGGGWSVLGVGDFDGDGKADVLWHYTPSGLVASWTSTAGYTILGSEGGGWQVIGTGDFNGDGKADLLWSNLYSGLVAAGITNGSYLAFDTEGGGWEIVGVGDINGDGTADLIWHNIYSGVVSGELVSGGYLSLGTEGGGWTVIGSGDFDGDGICDVLWRNSGNGLIASWTSGGGFTVFGVEGGGWAVIP